MYGYTEEKEKTAQENRTGIPDTLLQKAEQKSGMSLRDVRVHYNSPEPENIQAYAYTRGNEVFIGPGREQYLSHELGHVVQQKQGRVLANSSVNGLPLNDEAALEKEADNFL